MGLRSQVTWLFAQKALLPDKEMEPYFPQSIAGSRPTLVPILNGVLTMLLYACNEDVKKDVPSVCHECSA